MYRKYRETETQRSPFIKEYALRFSVSLRLIKNLILLL